MSLEIFVIFAILSFLLFCVGNEVAAGGRVVAASRRKPPQEIFMEIWEMGEICRWELANIQKTYGEILKEILRGIWKMGEWNKKKIWQEILMEIWEMGEICWYCCTKLANTQDTLPDELNKSHPKIVTRCCL